MTPLMKVGILIGGLIALNAILGKVAPPEPGPTSSTASTTESAPPAQESAQHVEAPRPVFIPPWSYSTDTDSMTGKREHYAQLRSKNSLQFDFPYRGENHGTLVVRKHPRYGLDVYVTIEKGQILCRRDDCRVLVRFDDAKPVTFSGAEPDDIRSTAVFLLNENRFIARAKKAKRILVQMTYYQAGGQVLEFEADSPLQWPPPM